MTIFNQAKSALQQWTVQYTVRGTLDGTTPAPDATSAPKNEENVWIVDVPGALGIIDPDLGGGSGSFGDRFITFIRVESSVPMPLAFGIAVVDASLLVPSLGIVTTRQVFSNTVFGETEFTSTECIYVAQGKALQIGFLPAPAAGSEHRITIGVRAAATGDDEARLARMCCCLNGGDGSGEAGGGGGGGVSPIAPGPVFQSESFSSDALSVGESFGDAYFRFSADYLLDVDDDTFNQSLSIITSGEGQPNPSAIRMMTRAGSVSRMVIRGTAPALYQWFVEVDSGSGFDRTYVMDAPALLVADTTTIVDPDTIVTYAAGDRVRSGLTFTTNAVIDLQISLEFTQAAS